jgi:hypothetical protein
MYRFFILLAFILVNGVSLHAQTGMAEECATLSTPDPYFDRADFEQFRLRFLANKSNNDLIQIPVAIRIVNYTLGGGGLDRAYIPEIMDSLNARFASTNLQFFQCQDPVDVFENKFYDFDRTRFSDSLNSRNIPDVLNIYFINKVLNDDEFLCGYARFPWVEDEYIVVANSCAINGSTVAHEVGHFLGLLHTHETIRGIELADGSNCQFRGDEICDTPADPRLGTRNVDINCNYTGNERDINNDPYDPDPTNIMSYSRKACRTSFTEEQTVRMNYYLERDYQHLVCSQVTSTEELFLEALTVYPNPAHNILFLEMGSEQSETLHVQLLDAFGRVHEQTVWQLNTGHNQLTLQLEGRAAGMYFLGIGNSSKKLYKKVVIR